MKDDLISRQAAIDALEKVADMFPWRVPGNRDTYDRYNEAWNDAIGRAEMEIENMPPAQPGWIPWDSGRFPEESGCYIVTAYDGSGSRVTFAKYQKRLKPCPFCGGEAAVMYAVTDDGTKTISVVCQKCSIGIFRARTSENDWNAWEKPEKAIAAWNRREGGQDEQN